MFVGLVVQEYFSSAGSSRLLRGSSSLDQMLTVCYDSMFLGASPLIPNNVQGFRVLDSPLAEREGCDFPVTWFLKLAGYFMPLWEEGIAVFVSEPVTGVIGKSKSRLARFSYPLGRAILASSSDSRVVSTFHFSWQTHFLLENLACPIPICL